MTPSLRARLVAQIAVNEGCRLKPYRDTRGYLTIGIGRCLDTKGITRDEALYLMENDLDEVIDGFAARWPWAGTLEEPRLAVLIEMGFNLGLAGLADFRKMWAALRAGDAGRAAAEMLDSTWARQVGERARRLAQQMRTAEWPQGEGI